MSVPVRSTWHWHGDYDDFTDECLCFSDSHFNEYLDPDSDSASEPVNHENYIWGDTWLQTTDAYYGNPIVIEILDYFLELPPCKAAVVHRVGGLEARRLHLNLPLHDPWARIFDRRYMEDLFAALEFWLRGKRDDVELPQFESMDGEPRLEQLAYEWDWSRFYCDFRRHGSGQ